MYSFYADKCAVELSADGSSFAIKSSTNPKCIVDIKFTRTAPGFVVGENGVSTYGTDVKNPWGSMRHAFWPRCRVEGTFVTSKGEENVAGKGCFIHALQGMKPHHAASRWNFVNFQGPTTSAIMMEFTTPPSYGSTVVNVGGIATDDKLLYAGAQNTATHASAEVDKEVNWPEPKSLKFEWNPQGTVSAELAFANEKRADRVDVMAEVPGFVKQIVSSAAGTRPYIYQVCSLADVLGSDHQLMSGQFTPKAQLSVSQDGQTAKEDGVIFSEATFIS